MITSVVTRSRLCPPTSSWPQTPGCHIPGFVLWMCVPMAREVGGLREGVWGGCHPWAEARVLSEPCHSPRHPQWETSAILPKSTQSQCGLGLPVCPYFFRWSWTSLSWHWPWPHWRPSMQNPTPARQRTVFVSLCKWRQEARAKGRSCLKCFLQLHWKIL